MSRAGSRARCVSTLVMVFVAVAVAPRACAAANAWKAAENKLRQEGLLVDDAGLPDDGESAAAVEAGPAERVSPAEEKFRAARDILSEFTTRHRRNARAVGWLREALALDPNHREAMTLLGRAYQMGEGVEPDEALAMEHFRRAADLGDPGAHFELGFAYSVGWVRPRASRRVAEPNPSRSPLLPVHPTDTPRSDASLLPPLLRVASRRTPRSRCFISISRRSAETRAVRWPWRIATCAARACPRRVARLCCITNPRPIRSCRRLDSRAARLTSKKFA